MNTTRLNEIIDTYIDRFDEINDRNDNSKPYETFKWEAVRHFQKNFDIDAAAFGQMFKEATSKTDVLINNRATQPINGILKLCEVEEESVRTFFKELYQDDKGDIDARQNRIYAFVDKINELLGKYYNGKWKYEQDFRAALFYIVLYEPKSNYFYKATQVNPFFRYLEFGEEVGSGSYFSLSRYYRMCDKIREELIKREDLLNKDAERFAFFDSVDDDYHILTFDLIYSGQVYEFYPYMEYRKALGTKVSKKQQVIDMVASLKEQLDEELGLLNELEIKINDIPDVSITGEAVFNARYGKGKVIMQEGTYLTVKFDNVKENKSFALPACFAKGFLKPDKAEIIDICKKWMDYTNEIAAKKQIISYLQSQIRQHDNILES